MQNKTKNSKTKTPPATSGQKVHHYIRTVVASLFGTIALSLIFASILLVWLNRTITNTNTYVDTVAPLVTKPDVQKFIADKAATALVNSAPTSDLASQLLTPAEVANKTVNQLKSELKPVVSDSVLQVVQSQAFAKLWKDTNRNAHQTFVTQLQSNSSVVELDLTPVATGLTEQIKQTKLAPMADKISLNEGKPIKLDLKGGSIDKAHRLYDGLRKGTLLTLLITALCIGLSIIISVHHKKTARRILVGTGVMSLFIAMLLKAVSIAKPSGMNELERKAAIAISATIFHNLFLACLVLGVACVGLAVGSKVYDLKKHRP